MELLLASREVAVAMRATATLTLVGLITPSGDAVTAQRSVLDTTSKLEIYDVDQADLTSNIGTQWFNGGEVVVSWNTAGEVRSYNTVGNYFRGISPNKTVIEGGTGGWEFVLEGQRHDGPARRRPLLAHHADDQLVSHARRASRVCARHRSPHAFGVLEPRCFFSPAFSCNCNRVVQ